MEIKFLKRKKSFKKGSSEINPGFYWKLILGATILIILASFVFSFYLFMRIDKDPILPAGSAEEQVKIIKKEEIEKVLEYFSEREKKSADILNSPSPVIDPSL